MVARPGVNYVHLGSADCITTREKSQKICCRENATLTLVRILARTSQLCHRVLCLGSGVLCWSAVTESQSASRSVSLSLSVADPPATSTRYQGKFVQLVPLMQPVRKGQITQPSPVATHGMASVHVVSTSLLCQGRSFPELTLSRGECSPATGNSESKRPSSTVH